MDEGEKKMSKLKHAPLEASLPAQSNAAAGIRSMRDRLAQKSPGFKAAVDLEEEAENFCQEIRKDLRQQRKLKGFDQRAMGKRLDMSQSAVSKIETAEGDMGVKTLFRYAQALGLHPVCVFVPAVEHVFGFYDKAQPENASRMVTAKEFAPLRAAMAFQKAEVGLIRDMCKSVSDAMTGAMAGLVREIE
jgi:transcriptional regulator with XRE-family HTH domain